MAKKRTMNELRQTKEYKLSDQGGTYNVPYKGAPVQEIMAQQIDEEMDPSKYDGDIHQENLDKASAEGSTRYFCAYKKQHMNPSKYTENDLEQAKCAIVEKILKHLDDTLFEMVCEEMSNNYLFQSDNYLTEAGYDIWEDEWFEFYHEHHGDILAQLNQRFSL